MKNLFLVLTSSLLLIACQQSEVAVAKKSDDASTVSQSVENSTTKKETPVMDKKTITEVPIAVAVKAGAGLNVVHRLSSERAKIGVPYEIELDFSGKADSVLDAEFSTSSNIRMTSNLSEKIQMNTDGKSKTHTITLVPQTEGIHYVNIFQPSAQQKPTVIRVIAGDKDIKEYLKTPGTIVEQEDGSKVISMKADEG